MLWVLELLLLGHPTSSSVSGGRVVQDSELWVCSTECVVDVWDIVMVLSLLGVSYCPLPSVLDVR